MTSNVIAHPNARIDSCFQCGEAAARVTFKDQAFLYGEGKDQVTLSAHVPVLKCEACGFEYTDARAEELRHDAVCHHLGRLTPSELKGIREAHKASQQSWAERTGLSIASLKRWETGAQIQNEAYDRYIRLLADPAVYAKAITMKAHLVTPQRTYQFQTAFSEAIEQRSVIFVLHKRFGS